MALVAINIGYLQASDRHLLYFGQSLSHLLLNHLPMPTNSLIKKSATHSVTPNPISSCQYFTTEVSNSTEVLLTSDRELVVIDADVDNYQQLVRGIKPGINWMVLNPDRDGVQQITQILGNHRGIETLHIVSHGSPQCLH